MKRVFLGSFLEPTHKDALKRVQTANADLEERFQCKVRWSNPEKLHLTWLFIGDINEESLPRLERTIASTLENYRSVKDASPKYLEFDQVEIWFGRGEPRYLVLTPSRIPHDLLAYLEAARTALLPFVNEGHISQAQADLKPHITLLRFARRFPAVDPSKDHPLSGRTSFDSRPLEADYLTELTIALPLRHCLSPVSLVESKNDENVHRYSILKSFE